VYFCGFNFAIVAGVLGGLARRAVGERRGVFVALVGIALYAILVGANAAVVRAAIMSGLVLVARRLGRTTYALTSLAFATLAMTFVNPYTLWDAGFMLSATATLGLVLYADPLERAARALFARRLSEAAVERIVGVVGDALIVTTAAQITTTPYIVYTFRRLSLITLLVNFLVLPAQPPVMLWGGAGLLVGLAWLPAGQAIASVAWLCLAYTNRVIEVLADVPLATLDLDYVAPGNRSATRQVKLASGSGGSPGSASSASRVASRSSSNSTAALLSSPSRRKSRAIQPCSSATAQSQPNTID
jgi:competence protein ComEC